MVHLSLWSSEQVSKLSRDARILYIGLITLGDDDGRLKGSPLLIRSQIFPYDDDIKVSDVSKWLGEIEAQKLIARYEIEGTSYYYHPKWEDYQLLREDRRRESNIPAPLFEFSGIATNGQQNDNQMTTKSPHKISKVKISKVKIIDTVGADGGFQVFWGKYPRKVSRKAAWKVWQKIKPDEALLSKILRSLEVYSASDQWVKDAGRYIPHAATWLNGERWEDEVGPAKNRSSKYDSVTTKTVRG